MPGHTQQRCRPKDQEGTQPLERQRVIYDEAGRRLGLSAGSVEKDLSVWVQASLDYRQRLQALFFPEGIAYDGIRFNRTAVTAPLFNYLAPSESADERVVSQTLRELEPGSPLAQARRCAHSRGLSQQRIAHA
jgi:hypothetical protein